MSYHRIHAIARRLAALSVLVSAALVAGLSLSGAAFAQVQPPDVPAGPVGAGAPVAPPITSPAGGTSLWAFVLVALAAALLTLAVVGCWHAVRRVRQRSALAAA